MLYEVSAEYPAGITAREVGDKLTRFYSRSGYAIIKSGNTEVLDDFRLLGGTIGVSLISNDSKKGAG